MENIDIKNKMFKNICACGQKAALVGGLALGVTGTIFGINKMAQENKGKPLVGVVNVPHGHEGDVNGGTLLTLASVFIAGASAAGLRKIAKDQGRQ